jgi:hypothetical protein
MAKNCRSTPAARRAGAQLASAASNRHRTDHADADRPIPSSFSTTKSLS